MFAWARAELALGLRGEEWTDQQLHLLPIDEVEDGALGGGHTAFVILVEQLDALVVLEDPAGGVDVLDRHLHAGQVLLTERALRTGEGERRTDLHDPGTVAGARRLRDRSGDAVARRRRARREDGGEQCHRHHRGPRRARTHAAGRGVPAPPTEDHRTVVPR